MGGTQNRTRTSGTATFLAAVAFVACTPTGPFEPEPSVTASPYADPALPVEIRVNNLISRMTLEEKVSQMSHAASAVDRLGIPEYDWWSEALHGVARAGRATVFPQAIGLAATWDAALMFRVATATSDEARAKHHDSVRKGRRGIYEGLTFFSPNINIFRDPRWGRGMETYGEDPYLAGRLAVQFVRGLQGDDPRYLKTVATAKHYAVHSGPEPDRHTFNAVVDERDLRETYLPAFRAAVVEGGAGSVMCAYNRTLGEACCASDRLLRQILRNEWGFDGYVVSDCWAIQDIYATHRLVATAPEAAAMGVAAGTDLNCGVTYDSLVAAVRLGLITEEAVDLSLARLLRARFKLGMFDPPDLVGYANIPLTVNDSEVHRRLALEAARKSIVLLKNDGDLLPLSKDLRTLAVIGPNADDVETLLGNYNGIPAQPVTPLEGIRSKVGAGTEVFYARGSDIAKGLPSFQVVPASALRSSLRGQEISGLTSEYFDNYEWAKPSPDSFSSRADSVLDFNWWEDPPLPGMRPDSFSVRWQGRLIPPETGTYALGVRVFGHARLFLDDSLIVEYSDRHVVMTRWADVELAAGEPRSITVEYRDRRADASLQLVWSKPVPDLRDAALAAAGAADAVILVLGLSPRLEGEEMRVDVPGFAGGDRIHIGLPEPQEELLRSIAALGKPTVLVLLNGSALAVNWAADNVPAIVEAWYPGQAAGLALADVLFGDYNPAGRLPVTFYRSVEQLPPFADYAMAGRTYRYFDGEPLFPFGHGLSYTTFRYENLVLPPQIAAGESLNVSVDVENVGSLAGDEVVQLYLSHPDASVPVPIRALQGFDRVFLAPGERQTVSFELTPRQLSLIDSRYRRIVEPGVIEISVGGKQPGFSGPADARTTGVLRGRLEIVGDTAQMKP
jgi:beta-glucosidase